jgi:hypothetical protein
MALFEREPQLEALDAALADPGHEHPSDRGPAGPRAPGSPDRSALGGSGVLESAYANAGFEDVDVRPFDAPVRFPTAADCVRFERESFGALHTMLANVTPAERDRAWREIEADLRQFENRDGFDGPCQLLIGSARRDA